MTITNNAATWRQLCAQAGIRPMTEKYKIVRLGTQPIFRILVYREPRWWRAGRYVPYKITKGGYDRVFWVIPEYATRDGALVVIGRLQSEDAVRKLREDGGWVHQWP